MGAGKKKNARRKKRISKHVLKSRDGWDDEKTAAAVDEAIDTPQKSEEQSSKKGKKKRRAKGKVKDLTEITSYLSAWKHRHSGNNIWKFNTNTQSWLLRHMYDGDKLNKTTFGLMMEYLGGIQSDVVRGRVLGDATRRALRYKEWEKKQQSPQNEDGGEAEGRMEEEESGGRTGDETTKDVEGNDTAAEQEQHDAKRWAGLDEHDKRKEYKRARKVIDTLGKQKE